jgi:hypothetical protein
VDNSGCPAEKTLICRFVLHCPHTVHRRLPVNKLCISIYCRLAKLRYDLSSSLKERSRQDGLAIVLFVSRIIPGDWGKVGPGWLARFLGNRIERFGGEAAFTSSSGMFVNAKRE